MKRTRISIIAVIATLVAAISISTACSKDSDPETDENAVQYFNAWISLNYPNVAKTGRGIYIIDDQPGTGETVTSTILQDHYVFLKYTAYDLDGTISTTYDEDIAKQTGDYTASSYYGPVPVLTGDDNLPAGLMDLLSGMKVGGTRTAVIPGWLTEAVNYDTEEKYIQKCSGDNVIYTVTLCEITDDILKWEISQLEKYKVNNMADVDSTTYGVYFYQMIPPVDTISMNKDTTIYINYIGRLLNGTVFDTNIADTAKFYGIYSEDNEYGPSKITMAEDSDDITMGDDASSVVTGFSYGISLLHPYEKGRCAFVSNYGYSSTGSDPAIPAYAPLVFDIEVVDEPTDD